MEYQAESRAEGTEDRARVLHHVKKNLSGREGGQAQYSVH